MHKHKSRCKKILQTETFSGVFFGPAEFFTKKIQYLKVTIKSLSYSENGTFYLKLSVIKLNILIQYKMNFLLSCSKINSVGPKKRLLHKFQKLRKTIFVSEFIFKSQQLLDTVSEILLKIAFF